MLRCEDCGRTLFVPWAEAMTNPHQVCDDCLTPEERKKRDEERREQLRRAAGR